MRGIRSTQLALAGMVVALAASALVLGVGVGGSGARDFVQVWLLTGVTVIAAGLCADRARRVPAERAPWLLLGAGLLSFALGDLYWSLTVGEGESPPIPSPADLGYLGLYPCCYVGLVLLLRARIQEARAALWLDGLGAGLVAGAVGAAVVVDALSVGDASFAEIATNLAYPVGDLVLLGLVVGLIGVTGWRPGRTWVVLAGGFALFTVVDAAYLIGNANGTYAAGAVLDAGWAAAAFVVGLAAAQTDIRRRAVAVDSRRLLVAPVAIALVAITLLAASPWWHTGPVAVMLAAACLLVGVARTALTIDENGRYLLRSRTEALTDSLTGLGNRRRLIAELDRRNRHSDPELLCFFDLNGFKAYNDAFGHPAGDALLARLGSALAAAVAGRGAAYRLGGDEFCALVDDDDDRVGRAAALAGALAEHGDGFAITAAHGSCRLPLEAADTESALRLADERMYAQKNSGRASVRRQSTDLLLMAHAERHPGITERARRVADLAEAAAAKLGLDPIACEEVRLTAELHDIGTMAVPDAVLAKPGALSHDEWAFVRQHTAIGERILSAAPSLRGLAPLVRSAREHVDGSGYPDGLRGDEIPLASRIVGAASAYVAMTSDRPHRTALSPAAARRELLRRSGSQFDPAVATAVGAVAAESAAAVGEVPIGA